MITLSPKSDLCPFCQKATLPHKNSPHCGGVKCRLAWQKLQQDNTSKYWQDKKQQFEKTVEGLYSNWQKDNNLDTENTALATIPYNHQETEKTTQERIDYLFEYLNKIAHSLESVDTETKLISPFDTSPHQHIEKYLPKLCATCKGRCCQKGKNHHAFIQRSTLIRILEEDPEQTIETILEGYRAHIPEHAVSGSCIYHTDKGCNLDPKLRADICGEFFCLELNNFIDENQGTTTPSHVLAVATDECEVVTWHPLSPG